jgi:hypothetical protein
MADKISHFVFVGEHGTGHWATHCNKCSGKKDHSNACYCLHRNAVLSGVHGYVGALRCDKDIDPAVILR